MTLLTEKQEDQFKDQGFLILKKLFDEEEIKLLKELQYLTKNLINKVSVVWTEMGKRCVLHCGTTLVMEFMECSQDATS